MTETMTADQAAQADWKLNPGPVQNLPDVAAVPADIGAFSLAVRRMLGLENASDGEIELFFHVCHKSGLDPFNKEVYMIGRDTDVSNWEPADPNEPDGARRKVVRRVMKYTIQTAINGFRKRAREIADNKGIEYKQGAALWCGDDGNWREVWPESKTPVAAKFTVFRDGNPYTFVAHYDEYVQMAGQPAAPNSMWKKMPRNQLRKCAEAGAIQAAFPDELGGLLLEDAVQPDIVILDEDGQVQEPKQEPRRGGKGVGGLADRAAKSQVIDAETDDEPGQGGGNDQSDDAAPSSGVTPESDSGDQEPADDGPPKSKLRKPLETRLFKLIDQIEPKPSRDDRLDIYRSVIGRRDIASTNDLSDVEVTTVGQTLYSWREDGSLNTKVHNILMAADAAATEPEGTQS